MKNERPKPNNPTETRTISARTQTAKPYSELGMNDSTGIQLPKLPQARGSRYAPPQRTPWVDEVESRGWGRRAPQSPSSSSFGAPQGNNKIYTYDVVFSPGEARKKNQRTTSIPYKITKDISQTQFDRQTASYSTNPPTASQSTCPQVRCRRAGRYWMPRHPRTCRTEIRRLQVDTKAVGQGPTYMSRFSAYLAFASINSRRGSTRSPMRTEKISSQTMASSISTLSKVRFSGSIVVSHS